VPFTIVSFHAHPDDEALLTGGTLARAAAEGHRVVLVTATAGEAGLSDRMRQHAPLGERRRAELARAASALGCARWELLDYEDSGWSPPAGHEATVGNPFSGLDPAGPAERLAGILREERADALTVYDPHGGYGHPDHVQVHRVGTLAAAEAGTPVVLEATVPGRLFRAVLLVLRAVGDALGSSSPLPTRQVFAPPGSITHRVRVTGSLSAKRAAMGAHGSQTRAEGRTRVLTRLLELPRPLYALAFGHEWYIEQGRAAGALQGDVFASVREPRTSRDEGRRP
jgi:LmbE family N-acetylglucosaminyl deacetylase